MCNKFELALQHFVQTAPARQPTRSTILPKFVFEAM